MNKLNFDHLFNASPNPYLVMSPTFVILGANRAYLDVTGRTLPEIADRSIFDAFPSDDAENALLLRESLERVVRLRSRDELPLIRYGLYHETASGRVFEERFWSATHTPLLDESGEVRYVLQHTEDVSELHRLRIQSRLALDEATAADGDSFLENRILQRAEAVQQKNDALQAEAGRLRRLFAQAPGFISLLRGPRHIYEMANDSFCQLIGRSDIVGKPAREITPEVEGQGLFELIDQVYASGTPQLLRNRSVRLRRMDGGPLEERFVDVLYQAVLENDGTVSGVFMQGNDITEQRHAEIELRRHRDELERLVAQRTDALNRSAQENARMQATLLQSQKMESLGKLTGGVAHDFNNALQIIAGNLHLLRKTLVSDEAAQRRLTGALAGVERGAKLASHLLAFARKQPLEPVVLNVSRLLRDLDDMLRRALGETVELETVVAGGLWNTLADRNFLENALLNLAINARDAMQGQGRLTIEAGNASLDDAYSLAHHEVSAGQYVMIAVSDTGCGMSEDIAQKIFEPFFTTKAEGHGTGLGLSMVYGFVKQSGGHIKVYSEVGAGTTIKVYLPRALESEQSTAPLTLMPAVGGSETILVVEDDEQVRETVVDLLGDLGYTVLKASDAQSALAVIESGVAIDLLFTDVVMPGTLRSPELARRAKIAQPQIEVLFTSGYTENAIVHGGRLDKGVALLSKPYPREELARKIRHILSNRAHAHRLHDEVSHLSEQTVATDRASRNMASLRVLVVEDNLDALASTRDILEHLGHRPTGVPSAEAALRSLESAAFDVLMTDLNLPGMSGHALAAQARARHPDLLVIFASGMDGTRDATTDVHWLPKPFGTEDIQRALAAATLQRHAGASSPESD
ncbi:hypothetical protein BH10PSE18_BH10PSE18_01970 [soil metagenome]